MSKIYIQHIRNSNYSIVMPYKSLSGESSHPIMRYNYKNTKAHEIKKLEVCMELTEQGHKLLTECLFKNGSRADIYDLDDGVAIEIVASETDKSIKNKEQKYPCKVITVRC